MSAYENVRQSRRSVGLKVEAKLLVALAYSLDLPSFQGGRD
jgi:hypothetical protein